VDAVELGQLQSRDTGLGYQRTLAIKKQLTPLSPQPLFFYFSLGRPRGVGTSLRRSRSFRTRRVATS
jgi:hypothetical protein